MGNSFFVGILLISISYTVLASSSSPATLLEGSSLSVEKPDVVLSSPNRVFSAGFFPVGLNAYCFAVWFNEPSDLPKRTVVWTANRDQPVNGKRSRLSLVSGNLVLTDGYRNIVVWMTNTASSPHSTLLRLHASGNLELIDSNGVVSWQSFDTPTDTLLPNQPLAGSRKLTSSRSRTNVSSGFYNLFFDNDNVLRLSYVGAALSSTYWPRPWLVSWEAGRSTNNTRKSAVLDSFGNFSSSDDFKFMSADYGAKNQRIFRIDHDGNTRLYSRKSVRDKWAVTWQAFSDPCKIHGVCGTNSLCTYSPESGRKCSCLPGHKMRNRTDWFYGCEPEFDLSCRKDESRFVKLSNAEFYGYDYGFFPNYTFRDCQDLCLRLCSCVGIQYSYMQTKKLINFNCYPKLLLANGVRQSSFFGDIYLRVPKNYVLSSGAEDSGLNCSNKETTSLERTFISNELVTFMLWFASGVGGFEAVCVLLVWFFLIRTRENSGDDDDRCRVVLATIGFKRFSFSELKKATRGFAQEIGRGSGGIVYKGILSDSRVAAIKRLGEASGGEAEFLAEVSTIGRLNHMNLIQMWGYCVEGKHRLLVYEYLQHGSLAENLANKSLDWKKRFGIAVGTAKGLCYLHEECLEWVLHCDVKPQNILLASDYHPKVADFGLSKLLHRGETKHPSFSRIRGTRGYMAPEWVTNQPITAKVDVYSFGIVLLEMVTGKSPVSSGANGLVRLVKESLGNGRDEIVDESLEGDYDKEKMRILMDVALKCVEEEKEARPTMRQVVEMLQDC